MSSRPRSNLLRLGLAAGLVGALVITVQPAEAQAPPAGRPPTARPPHGHDRSNIPPRAQPVPPNGHDRSNIPPRADPDPQGNGDPHGPSDPQGPGGIESPGSMAGGNGVGQAARALATGTLTHPTAGLLPTRAQRAVLGLVDGTQAGAGAAVSAALAPSANRGAQRQAARLSTEMQGLIGRPDGLQDAVHSYNELVDASSEEFLRNPSPEFLTVQTVLGLMVEESLAAAPAGS